MIFFITLILRVPGTEHHPLHQAHGAGGLSSGSTRVTAGPESPLVLKHCNTGSINAIRGAALSAGRVCQALFWWKLAKFNGSLVWS